MIKYIGKIAMITDHPNQSSFTHCIIPKISMEIPIMGFWGSQLGVSENSVPLHPMVNDHYPVSKWLAIIGNIANIFRQTQVVVEPYPLLNGYNWEYTLFSDKPNSDQGTSTTRRHMAFCRAPLWRCTELCKQKCLTTGTWPRHRGTETTSITR